MSKSGPFKQMTSQQLNETIANHTVYLQACVNYIGRQLGWRKWVRRAWVMWVTGSILWLVYREDIAYFVFTVVLDALFGVSP